MRSRLAVTVLFVAGMVIVGLVGGVAGNTLAQSAPESDTYVIEQDGACQEIEPLSSEQSVEAFYDYRDHNTHPNGTDRMYSSYGTTHLQESDTSLLFLHQGTDGLSLVMVHDELDGETAGGVVTFELVGTPHDAEWAVRNDAYDGDTNRDEFETGDAWADADWGYIENRTGGGALSGGFSDPFAVTIHPAFNEDADLYDADVAEEFDDENVTGTSGDFWDGGELEDWHVLSGDVTNPDRYELQSLEEPVTIRTGTCGGPSVASERTDDGIATTISGASVDDRTPVQPTAGTGADARFDRIDVTGVEEATLEFENGAPADPEGEPAAAETLSQLSVTGNSSGDASGTVTFSVDADELDERGLGSGDVALYQPGDGEWNANDTDVVVASGDTYQFEAEVDSLEGLIIATQHEETVTESLLSTVGYASLVAVASLAVLSMLWLAGMRRR